MKHKKVLLIVAVLATGVIIFAVMRWQQPTSPKAESRDIAQVISQPSPPRESQVNPTTVPAHYEVAPLLSSLAATLAPEKFTGKTREAYQAAKPIPQTIAQMPCYCYCDRGMGHKSLHS